MDSDQYTMEQYSDSAVLVAFAIIVFGLGLAFHCLWEWPGFYPPGH